MGKHLFAVALLLTLLPWQTGRAAAQDTRAVTEPVYPKACKVLYAQLSAVAGTLPEDTVERHYRDNDRIEKAMDKCPAGQAVVLHASKNGRNIFLISPLRLRAGITLIVDASASVWASRDPRNYDVQPGSCGIVGERGPGCLPLLLAENAPHSGIMGEGVIDGRGGAKLLGQTETWWELAHRAKVEDSNQAVSRLLVVRRSDDFTLYRVTLRNSPNCHVTIDATNGFTAWGVRIDTPKWARNTDGIDPQAGSTNLSIIDSYIRSGDDNISPKSTAQGGAVSHMTVRNVHFYNGHGFGVGSQTSGGISALRVSDLSIDGSDNGIRIKSDKSRGGLVTDVRFEDVCMRNVINPIVLNPFYTTFDGTRIPVYRDVLLHNVHSLGSGGITLAGLDATHRLEATLDNVVIDGVKPADITSRHALLTVRHSNLEPQGEDVKISGGAGAGGGAGAYSCEGKFVPFPANTTAPVSAELIPPPDNTFYVAADGTGDYYSVQAAVNKVPAGGGLVLVAPGTYRERVFVAQSHVTLKSANRDATKTVIVSDTARQADGTADRGFATVTVRGDDFVAENITFANDGKPPVNLKAPMANDQQALHISGDRNVLRNVRLLGGQHTVYFGAKNCAQASRNPCTAGRTLVEHASIAGTFDFIYGDGTLFCSACELHSLEHAAQKGAEGFVTAQGKHYPTQPSEFVFLNARLTADPGVQNVFLGQPWRDFSTVVFLNPQIGPHIASGGFRERMGGGAQRMATAFFRVYKPTGTPVTAQALTPAEAAHYTLNEVLRGEDGWDPAARP